jgi:hypothetical protein
MRRSRSPLSELPLKMRDLFRDCMPAWGGGVDLSFHARACSCLWLDRSEGQSRVLTGKARALRTSLTGVLGRLKVVSLELPQGITPTSHDMATPAKSETQDP